jgi:EAL domain-containing protein (putative c-di-GMP-specific phosphodiesterase class I)
MLGRFRAALRERRLHMAYQPTIALDSGELTRVEALMRWEDATLGPISPSRFIPMAEQHDLIADLTQWGLSAVLRQWTEWRKTGLEIDIAFNISAHSLEQLNFPDLVEALCNKLEVPPDRLVLELTEGATQPLIKLMDTLTRFRIKGIGLALDDFGTGYSSLLQLRQLPFTAVKIDRAFVSDLSTSRDCRLITRAMIDLAHGLGLSATAEGIETAEQLRILREFGCDLAQGYLISAALEPQTLDTWRKQFETRWPDLIAENGESLSE